MTTKKAMMSASAMQKQLAADAAKEYDSEKTGGGGLNISISGGEFRMNGEDLGDEMDAVIVANAYEHAWYDSPYNRDDPQPPACFAIGEDEDELVPHETSPNPQADTCADCWANEWGSSDTGRGKACKNSRRLALLASGEDGVSFSEMPVMKVPPASLRNYSGYAKRSTKTTGLPTYGLISRIGFDPNAEYETLVFELAAKVDDPETIAGILQIRDQAKDLVVEPFDVSGYKTPEEVKAGRRGSGPKKAAPKKKATVKKKAPARRGRSKMS